jgi:hypothetical protein
MTFYHPHKQPPGAKAADAILPKENIADPHLYSGHVGICECGVKLFFPDDKRLHPVEVEHEI